MMKIDLFSHFSTREFREAYFSIPLGGKGRRLDPLAIRTYTRGQIDTDIDVLWDVDQRIRILDRHGVDLAVLAGGQGRIGVPSTKGAKLRESSARLP